MGPIFFIMVQKNEGLKSGCTAKVNEVGSINVNFAVDISYNKGVVLCEHYRNSITSQKLKKIIRDLMPEALEKSIDPKSKRILMDGCPQQNSKLARKAFEEIGVIIFKIPSHSPDLNPIENFFGLVVRKLRKQVLEKQIESETYDEFMQQFQSVMLNFSVEKIKKIIESMSRKFNMVIKKMGVELNTKY